MLRLIQRRSGLIGMTLRNWDCDEARLARIVVEEAGRLAFARLAFGR
jgi:hypothetical protein